MITKMYEMNVKLPFSKLFCIQHNRTHSIFLITIVAHLLKAILHLAMQYKLSF